MWLFSLFLILPAAWACKDREKISPCTCDELQGLYSYGVICGAQETYEVIGKAVQVMRGRRDIYSFTIEDSILNFIPHDAFQDLQFKVLELTRNTLQALTDTDEAFLGLEDSLEILRMEETTLMSGWDWSILRNLKKLEKIEVGQANLKFIDNGVGLMSAATLKEIHLHSNEIAYVGDKAFADFVNLKELSLDNNMIREVKRSMMPDPAPRLGLIGFYRNELQNLPTDIFTNMPNLKILNLGYNKLLFLDEKTFKPVWHHLQRFTITGNNFRCDCRMSWILQQAFPGYFNGQCGQPQRLRGRNINSLSPNELFCFVQK